MQYLVKGGNSYGVLRIELKPHEFIHARENALCAFEGPVVFTQSRTGGFFRRIARKFSGEHLTMQQIEATEENAWVMLAPPMPGAISAVELHGKNMMVVKDAFLAAGQSIGTNGKLHKLAHFETVRFGGEGLIFLNAFGAIENLSLLPEQVIRIHPRYLIAWEEQLNIGSTDRGYITVTGPGRLWLQTREADGFHDWQDGLKEARKSANS